MNSKMIKRQLIAAIAMTLVATVALGSSTFAWFVSNNTVKATTATISAQSNAPFLKIAKTGEELVNTAVTQVAGAGDKTTLYPAQWNNIIAADTYQFESAYAAMASEATQLEGSRFAVGGVDAAKRPDYALKQSFDIGTTDDKAGGFQNLKVANVEINIADTAQQGLADALCVLVKCGDNWGVYKKSADGAKLEAYGDGSTIANNLTGTDAIAATITAGDKVTVDTYTFYDGSYSSVYTDNLPNLATCGVTITFTATPVNTDGNAVTTIAPQVLRSSNVLSLSETYSNAGNVTYTYQWYKDGAEATGETNATYTVAASGNYHCVITKTDTTNGNVDVTKIVSTALAVTIS